MSGWWYAIKDKKFGPVEAGEMKRLLQTGSIGAKTIVWREGMESWRPLDEVEELRSLMTVMPPPLPPKVKANEADYPNANRWSRFFARTFDVWWETLLVAFVSSYLLSRYSASFVEWIHRPGTSQIFGIFCLPGALVFDALMYRLVGNTPGKALLGIKVNTSEGKSLNLAQYLVRNFSMWARGLGLGIPIVNLFTMVVQSRRLGDGRQASYDESPGYSVRSQPSGWLRKIAFGCAFLSLFGIVAILNVIDKNADRDAVIRNAQKSYSWENPRSLVSTKVDSRWKASKQTPTDGAYTYLFTEATGYALVVFAVQDFPSYSMSDYVSGFKQSTSKDMVLDGGRFFERGGRQIWEGSGRMIASDSARLNVQVIQSGSSFWRVVTVQSIPYKYSDGLVEELRDALWTTVK